MYSGNLLPLIHGRWVAISSYDDLLTMSTSLVTKVLAYPSIFLRTQQSLVGVGLHPLTRKTLIASKYSLL